MKTLLCRSTLSPSKLIGATLMTATISMPAIANDTDLDALVKAAQKEGRGLQCGYAR